MPNTLDKPRTATMTLKLDTSHRDRLRSLAVARKRSSHYLMKEANKFHRPKGRCIGFPESKEGTPQGAGNIPAVIYNMVSLVSGQNPNKINWLASGSGSVL